MLLKDYAENGLPFADIPVIDVHGHLSAAANPYIPYPNEEDQAVRFLETLDSVGVDYAIVSMQRGFGTNELDANLDLAKIMTRHPRLLGWVTYIPFLPQPSLDIADACYAVSDRFVGMKIHPDANRCAIGGPEYAPLWEYADARGLRVLTHTWGQSPYSNPEQLHDIARRYPNVAVLIGHSGGRGTAIETAIALANRYDNLYLDLTGAFLYSSWTLERFVRKADPDKLLFSSDATYNDVTWEIGNIAYARVPEEVKEKVLGLNAKRLLKGVIRDM
ncbi:amidohydrolase family protein [Paenibacillus cymbidii]|uniref:amidohydrolase family protein n=1 Tax=Paenibacillus cymbidii TaxID=1639034 RepID=UPI0010819805|nr:amidohydrolase family protein [Paenibacillus cymbidii]